MATILPIGAGAIAASAQAPDAGDAGVDQSTDTRPWWLLWSETSRENRVILAQWTMHLRFAHQGLRYDGLVGVAYRGGFAVNRMPSP